MDFEKFKKLIIEKTSQTIIISLGGIDIRALKLFLSAEFFYILFLFSGVFKESISTNFDISIIFLVITISIVLYRILKFPYLHKYQLLPIICIFSLLAVILINIMFSSPSYETEEKLIKFLLLTLPSFLLPLFFVNKKDSIDKLLLSVSVLSIILSIFSLNMILRGSNTFIGFNDGNYLGLARIVGFGFLSLCYFLYTSKKKLKPIIVLCLIVVSFVLLSTGSRMPILAIVIASLYALGKSFILTKNDLLIKKKFIISLCLMGFLILTIPYFYAKGYFKTIFYRFEVLFSGGGSSTTGRLDRLDSSLKMFEENFIFGGGFGNFGDYYSGDRGVYAHNILLEFASELGLIGLLWLVAFFAIILINSFHMFKVANNTNSILQTALIICFFFFLLNSMVSGDLNDNRAMFACATILLIAPYLNNNNNDNNNNNEINCKIKR